MRTHRLLQHVEHQSKHNTPHLTINLPTNLFNRLVSTKLQVTIHSLHHISSSLTYTMIPPLDPEIIHLIAQYVKRPIPTMQATTPSVEKAINFDRATIANFSSISTASPATSSGSTLIPRPQTPLSLHFYTMNA
jgi:hypothetical protein